MKLVFENATIQDVIGKAAKVAPTRGAAFDAASGILITVEDGVVNVRATDTLVFYHEVVDAVSIEGEGEWRLPSVLLGAFFAKLSIGSGKTITMTQDGSTIHAKSGGTRAKFRTLDPTYYPSWEPFDVEDMTSISNLGERIGMVSWATESGVPGPASTVNFDGTRVVATNRIVLAVAPCIADSFADEPVMIPAEAFGSISSILKETSIGMSEGHMLVMPDDSTQIKVVSYAGDYFPVERIMNRDHPNHFTVSKTEMIEVIERAMVFSGNTRTPLMQIIVGQSEIAVFMKDQDQNSLGDIIETPGFCDHRRVTLEFTPQNILNSLRHAPNEQITFGYDATNPRKSIHIDGGSGYECWVAARSEANATEPTQNDSER